jgi:hypothetical protein
MTSFFFKEFFSFFKDFVLSGIFQTNRHLLILDDHKSHVTLQTLEQAMAFGLDMITLLLQPHMHSRPLMFHVLSHSKLHLRKKGM